MATPLGNLTEYDPGREDWTAYTERLQQFFIAYDIENENKQRAVLLSVCGSSTYQLIKNLISPEKPTDKTYAEIVQIMKDHVEPKPSIIVQRYTFHTRYRKEHESIATYVAELKKLSGHCGFGDTLNDMMRDRVVCGINDVRMQRRLLSEPELTYKKAFDLAQAMESAEKYTQSLRLPKQEIVHEIHNQTLPEARERGIEGSTENSVHIMGKANVQSSSFQKSFDSECYRCGGRHRASTCRFKEWNCFECGKQGHLAKVCRKRAKRQERPLSDSRKPKDTNRLFAEPFDENPDPEYALFNISDSLAEPIIVKPNINGVKHSFEVDTGATRSIISHETYVKLWSTLEVPPLSLTRVKLRTYTGETVKVMGEIQVEVVLNNQREQLSLLVAEGNGPSLLGRDWLKRIRLDWAN